MTQIYPITGLGKPRKRSDCEIRQAYAEYGSVWKAADALGMCGQSVHERLQRIGVDTGKRFWTDEEIEHLVEQYQAHADDGRLNELAEHFGRLKSNICRMARKMGLTNSRRSKSPQAVEAMGERVRQNILENGHPRGMLGKKHTPQTKRAIGEKSREVWSDYTEEKRSNILWKTARTRAVNGFPGNREKCSWRAGWREIGGHNKYYRSRWEANYARYLEFLKSRGEIAQWEHEPETFFFDGVRRGCVSYLPDFRVTLNNGSLEYHEVKGWMDKRSKTKLKRMAKYHPGVVMVLIQKKQYDEIRNKLGRVLPGWEE